MSWFSKLLPVIGTVVGAYFGGPAGAALGSSLGGAASGVANDESGGHPDPNRVQVTGQGTSGWQQYMPLAGAGLSYLGQMQTNMANASLAQRQMDFQAQMSGTSYQRAVQDMQAAGLNPMLAYSQGGASTPGGATASMENSLGSGVSSALQGYQTFQQIQQSKAQMEQLSAQTDATDAQAAFTRSQTLSNALNVKAKEQEIASGSASAAAANASADNLIQDVRLKSAAFASDVKRRRSESELASLEAAKQKVLKSAFEFAPNAWNRLRDAWRNPPAPESAPLGAPVSPY